MRCPACNSVVTKKDRACYVCGDPVPEYLRQLSTKKELSLFSNILFVVSLGFSLYSFLSDHKFSLAVSLVVSGSLLLLKVLADQYAKPSSDGRTRT